VVTIALIGRGLRLGIALGLALLPGGAVSSIARRVLRTERTRRRPNGMCEDRASLPGKRRGCREGRAGCWSVTAGAPAPGGCLKLPMLPSDWRREASRSLLSSSTRGKRT
jgi:hypothetical protein